MNVILIIGSPGSGKTTLSNELSRHLSCTIVSIKTLLEAISEVRSDGNRVIHDSIDQGRLVDQQIVNAIFDTLLGHFGEKKILIIDGYPKTYSQSQHLVECLKLNENLKLSVINLALNNDVALSRLGENQSCQERRCNVYRKEADLLVKFFKNLEAIGKCKLITLFARESKKIIFQQALKFIQKNT